MLRNLARRKNSAKNTSTASRTQRSTRVKKLQRLSLFQQQIRWNLCLVQTQRKKEKNEKSNWIFLFFFSLHGSPRRIIWVQQRYLKDFSINNQQIFIGSNLILRENKKNMLLGIPNETCAGLKKLSTCFGMRSRQKIANILCEWVTKIFFF